MRIGPDESLYMTTTSKVPGLTFFPKSTVMDMSYETQFKDAYVGDAYERMFLNAALGDQSLFVSADELVEMWRIFTPLLHQIDEQKPDVVIYPFGMVPPGYAEWATARGAAPKETWQEFLALHSDQMEELRKVFMELDTDNTGRLDAPEILELAKRFYDGRAPRPKEIHAIMERMSPSGSGSVSWDEFVAAAGVIAKAFRPRPPDVTDAAAPKPPPAASRTPSTVAPPALHFDQSMPFSVIIFGATGDLARKKLFPALYQLVLLGHLPRTLHIIGYGRSKVVLEEFLNKQCVNIKEQAALPKAEFLSRISFHAGAYDSPESYKQLASELTSLEGGATSNRLYFLAVPPPLFGDISCMINEHARAPEPGFTRIIIEKPFGRDSETFEELNEKTSTYFGAREIRTLAPSCFAAHVAECGPRLRTLDTARTKRSARSSLSRVQMRQRSTASIITSARRSSSISRRCAGLINSSSRHGTASTSSRYRSSSRRISDWAVVVVTLTTLGSSVT